MPYANAGHVIGLRNLRTPAVAGAAAVGKLLGDHFGGDGAGGGVDLGRVQVEGDELPVQVLLLHVRQDVDVEAPLVILPAAVAAPKWVGLPIAAPIWVEGPPGRELAIDVVV